ncbi:MAG TPA: dihydrolipoamide acetyltransferase family protein [Stellaceae bacterium]|nr:dihydrolipoamide acetyltransferase family protein [Stellaceae bacterium]
MAEFRMPSLGADMVAGTLVEWLRRPGDRVRRGDIVAVVETQKGAIEIEIFQDGVIERLLVEVGTTVPVGTPLALVSGIGVGAPAAPTPPPLRPEAVVQAPAPRVPIPGPQVGRPLASPAARRIAQQFGVDLRALRGTGPGGAIVSADVEQAAKAPRRFDPAEMRRAIGAAMARSKREIPHYYLSTTIDITVAQRWMEARNAERPPPQRLLLAAPLLKAVALALRGSPELNGYHGERGFEPSPAIHIGVAIAIRGGGLMAPAIHDVDKLGVDELMAKLRDLGMRARSGGLRSSELSDSTITVTNIGERGVEAVFGIIYPPQVALVGLGKPMERPAVIEGKVLPRRTIVATLSADHRASDGHRGALFLAEMDRLLQAPEQL